MLCACLDKLAKLPALFANVPLNLAAGVGVSASLAASANAALAAGASLGAAANAALGLAVNANLSISALLNLTALANFNLAMKIGLGLDLGLPGGGAALGLADLLETMLANKFAAAMSALPLFTLPTLGPLGLAASGMAALNAGISPNLALGLNAALSASLGVSASAALAASAQMNALLNAMAAVQAGFGINLAAGVGGLGAALGAMSANLAAMPNFGLAISLPLLQKVFDFLNSLNMCKALGLNLCKPLSKSAMLGAFKAPSLALAKGLNFSKSLSMAPSLSKTLSKLAAGNFSGMISGLPGVPGLPNLLALVLGLLLPFGGATATAPCNPLLCLLKLSPMCLCPAQLEKAAEKALS